MDDGLRRMVQFGTVNLAGRWPLAVLAFVPPLLSVVLPYGALLIVSLNRFFLTTATDCVSMGTLLLLATILVR